MPLTPATAYTNLVANPGVFLKRYPVRIFGDTAVSGPVNYSIINRGPSMRPGSMVGGFRLHATEAFDIRSAAAMVAVGGGGHTFMAHSVHMDKGTGEMNFYMLDATGPSIMVTGQLSGCSFVMIVDTNQGQVRVAHVQPQGMTGEVLHGKLTKALSNAQIYGAADYDVTDRVASIIGVRAGGGWTIYAQKQDAIEGDYRIKSLYQIYPTRQKL